MTAFRVMMKSVEESLRILKETGTQEGILERMTTREDLYKLINYQAYETLDNSLATEYTSL